ncbi:MAG: hypothetical protein QOI25_3005 [Mycobacterium sp.]|jgi:hypothetical protein|nr:hypothetical protein [Mycobacterium sp.]
MSPERSVSHVYGLNTALQSKGAHFSTGNHPLSLARNRHWRVIRAVAADDKILAKTIARVRESGPDLHRRDQISVPYAAGRSGKAIGIRPHRTDQSPDEWRRRRGTRPARATSTHESNSCMPFPGVVGARTMETEAKGR